MFPDTRGIYFCAMNSFAILLFAAFDSQEPYPSINTYIKFSYNFCLVWRTVLEIGKFIEHTRDIPLMLLLEMTPHSLLATTSNQEQA